MAVEYQVKYTPGFDPTIVNVSQNDVGRQFNLKIIDETGAAQQIPSGSTVKFVGMKPSGLGFTVNCTFTNSVVHVTTTDIMTDEHGLIPAEVQITNGNTVIGTANVNLRVEKNPHPEGTIDDNLIRIIPTFDVIYQRLDILESSMHTAENNISNLRKRMGPVEDQADDAYALASQAADMAHAQGIEIGGIRRGYDGTVYQTAGDAVRAQAFRGTDTTLSVSGKAADAKKTGSEISFLNETLDSVKRLVSFNPLLNIEWESGSINPSSGLNQTDPRRIRNKDYINIGSADKISISINTGYKYYYFFYDENKTKISNSSAWTIINTNVTKPDGAVYMRVTLANTSDTTADISYAQYLSITYITTINTLQNSIDVLKDGIITDNLVDLSSELLWKPGESDGTSAGYKIYQDIKFPCSQGDIFYIASVSLELMKYTTCGFFASDGTSLGRQYSYADTPGVFMTKTAIAPANAAYMMVSISTGVGTVRVTPETFFASDPQIYVGKTNITKASDIYKKYETVSFSEFYKLRDEVLDDTVSVPTYWQSYMNTKIKTLQDLDGTIGTHGFSFVFVTDIHWPDNFKNSPKLIKYILNHTAIDTVICGGDILTKHSSIDTAMSLINDWRDKTKEFNTINLFGNHDNNSNASNDSALWIGYNRWYGSLLKPIEKSVVWSDDKKYFYIDNAIQKIRMIFMNSSYDSDIGISTVQAAWLQQKIYNLTNGWKVIVFQHVIFNPVTIASGITELALNAAGNMTKYIIDGQYDSAINRGVSVIGLIGGHVHRDYSIVTDKGYPIIVTTCDAKGAQASLYDPDNPTRTSETTTEQAFDVYHIDTENRKVYITRIGAGSDREFTY